MGAVPLCRVKNDVTSNMRNPKESLGTKYVLQSLYCPSFHNWRFATLTVPPPRIANHTMFVVIARHPWCDLCKEQDKAFASAARRGRKEYAADWRRRTVQWAPFHRRGFYLTSSDFQIRPLKLSRGKKSATIHKSIMQWSRCFSPGHDHLKATPILKKHVHMSLWFASHRSLRYFKKYAVVFGALDAREHKHLARRLNASCDTNCWIHVGRRKEEQSQGWGLTQMRVPTPMSG